MKIIGLTGGIASGKSTVSTILKEMGIEVIDVDVVAREVVAVDTDCWRKIVDAFGQEVLFEDGEINRKKLGNVVFADIEKLNILNSITHPFIIERVKERIGLLTNDVKNKIIVIDAAILIEMGLNKLVDEIWVVSVDKETQISRLMERDNLSRENALNRIRSQLALDEKVKFATHVIDNSKDIQQVREQIHILVNSKLQH